MKRRTKTFLALVSLTAALVFAQSAPTGTTGKITANEAFEITFEQEAKFTTELYRNGVLLKTYAPTEVTSVRTNATTGYVTYKIAVPAQTKVRPLVFTAVSVDEGERSDPSLPLTLSVKPGTVKNLLVN